MKRIVGRGGLDGYGGKAIEAFCSGVPGDLRLDNTEDYKNILDVFQCFVAGAAWALEDNPASSWVMLLTGTTPVVSGVT